MFAHLIRGGCGLHLARTRSTKRAVAVGFRGLVVAVFFCTAIAGAQSVQARSQALNAVFTDYWQDHLRHTPEDATVLGDKRYNDRWSDLSPEEIKRSVLRSREYMQRLRAIDTTGL